ncbi:MAG: winged helix-turn-helix transcriptional regulator [Bdellovibrionaceae bacterium]|nr:winged helix-turn-helix transcriptional regulator [Pseudobdellovibrionaceae bacterium]
MGKKKGAEQGRKKTIYELQAEICSALANPIRIQILDLLAEGEKNSSDLLKILNVPKANLSQHLSVLKDAGIIQSRKEGLYQYLSLSIPKIKDACSLVRSVLIEKISQEEKQNAQIIRQLRAQG